MRGKYGLKLEIKMSENKCNEFEIYFHMFTLLLCLQLQRKQ